MSVINLAHPQAKGLVLLHDYAVDPRASDLSGNRNNGSLLNSPAIVGGKFGKALSLNGSSQGITVTESPSLDITGNEISFGCWVYPKGNSIYHLIGKDAPSSVRQYALFLLSSTSSIHVALSGVSPGDVGTSYTVSIPWEVNKWNHIFVTYKSGVGGAIYVNGRSAYSASWTGTISHVAANVHIGYENENRFYFNGNIAEARIYNRALSAAEVLDLYTNPRALFENNKKSIYVLSAAGLGAITHATSGVLANSGATIAGTAAHIAKHATTGVLANSGAVIAGSALNFTPHATNGVLANSGAAISGSALNFTVHTTTGVLTNSGAVITGSSDHVAAGGEHATSGALIGSESTISGISVHNTIHGASGALAVTGATLTGTSSNLTVHATSGALLVDGATLSGISVHSKMHDSNGALANSGSTLNGTASRYTTGTSILTQGDIDAIANAVWSHSSAVLIEQQLLEAWGRLGLDPSAPLVTGQTSITFGSIVMAMVEAAGHITVTRQ